MSNQAEQDRRVDYVEFATHDIEKTKAFYTSVFGWTFTDYGPDYTSFADGRLTGGFHTGGSSSESGALVVVYALDLEAIERAVRAHGGRILKPIFSFPGGRRFHFADPSGNVLAVWTDRQAARRESRMKPHVWILSVLLASLGVDTAQATESAVTDSRTDLVGRILDADEKPLRKANAYIYTASPRTGTSTVCPSCYVDCGKVSSSDNKGRFVVPRLSNSLLFQVLVTAHGYAPKLVHPVDPTTGPLVVELERRTLRPDDTQRSLFGRVVDRDGRAVIGAIVTPWGYRIGDRRHFGVAGGTDPLSITDDRGEFSILTARDDAAWFVQVRARDLATQIFADQATGKALRLELGPGAMLQGRVVRQGQPLGGVVVGMVQADRSAASYVGHQSIATDTDGRFLFANVTPGYLYNVYGTMETFAPLGALGIYSVEIAKEGMMADLGALEVTAGYRLGGRVRLEDGGPIPNGTRLLISREKAWDFVTVMLNEECAFALEAVPGEDIGLAVRVPGYRMSPESSTQGKWNPYGPMGAVVSVNGDMLDLDLLLVRDEDAPR